MFDYTALLKLYLEHPSTNMQFLGILIYLFIVVALMFGTYKLTRECCLHYAVPDFSRIHEYISNKWGQSIEGHESVDTDLESISQTQPKITGKESIEGHKSGDTHLESISQTQSKFTGQECTDLPLFHATKTI